MEHKKVIYDLTDGDYTMQLTTNWQPKFISLEPSEYGTNLNRKDVIKLIAVLSNWLDEREAIEN